jgi:hypothetical protein
LVKLFTKFVASCMLLLILGVPAMACMTPDSQLTEVEKACCKAMAHQCGDMADSSGHSCCETIVQHHDPAVLKSIPAPQMDVQSVGLVSDPSSIVLSSSAIVRVVEQLRHPPPSSFSPSIEILRI